VAIFVRSPSPPLLIIVFAPPSSFAPPLSGDVGERVLEGVPAANIVGHAVMDDGDGHLPLRQSVCMMCYNTQGNNSGESDCWQKKTGLQHKRHKPAQTGTNRHIFECCRGESSPLFLG
jgi:hypothetical protein